MSQLQDYLQRLNSTADYESSGVFTIDPSRVQARQRQMQAQPGAYLLKFMQAAVQLTAERVDIHLGAEAVLIRYREVQVEHFNERRLQELWGEREFAPEDDFRMALCAAPTRRLGVYWSRTPGHLLLDGQHLHIEDWPRHGQQDLVVALQRDNCPDLRAEEALAVCNAGGYTPTPVWLDGRQLRPELAHTAEYLEPGRGGCFVLPERPTRLLLLGEGGLRTADPSPAVALRRLQLPPGEIIDPGPCYRLAILCARAWPVESEIWWMRRGVLMEREHHPLACSRCRALVAADHLQTDISGLKLVRDEKHAAVVKDLELRCRRFRADLECHRV